LFNTTFIDYRLATIQLLARLGFFAYAGSALRHFASFPQQDTRPNHLIILFRAQIVVSAYTALTFVLIVREDTRLCHLLNSMRCLIRMLKMISVCGHF